jgi:hypothetical protein
MPVAATTRTSTGLRHTDVHALALLEHAVQLRLQGRLISPISNQKIGPYAARTGRSSSRRSVNDPRRGRTARSSRFSGIAAR